MYCPECQFVYDTGDAFCRKCGAALAQEGVYNEVEGSENTTTARRVITTVEVVNQENTPLPAIVEKSRKPNYLAKVSKALNSETGQKLVKGAALLAATIAAELMTQAANRSKQRQKNSSGKPTATDIVNALSPYNNQPGVYSNDLARPNAPHTENYHYYYERWVIRRTIRRDE
jgi:hypothetical protein